jgi:hypothetical protein
VGEWVGVMHAPTGVLVRDLSDSLEARQRRVFVQHGGNVWVLKRARWNERVLLRGRGKLLGHPSRLGGTRKSVLWISASKSDVAHAQCLHKHLKCVGEGGVDMVRHTPRFVCTLT